MVSEKRLKGRGNKQEESKSKTASWVILIIMVFSVAGFAMLSGGGHVSSESGAQSYDIELQDGVYQNPQTGERYWGARKNGEEFIFFSGVDGYEDNLEAKLIADNLKASEVVQIYQDQGFFSSDAIYSVEKSLNANDIPYFRLDNLSACSNSVLVLTNGDNESTPADLLQGCNVMVLPEGEESVFIDVLVYHLIK